MKIQSILAEAQSAKNYKVQCNQSGQNSQLAEMPAHNNFGFFLDRAAALSLLFPVAANGCCSSARIGADQISRSNGSGEVSAFGQMLALLAAREDAGVSAGCSCGPARDLFTAIEVDFQGPTGVNSSDLAHGDFVGSSNVLDYNFCFADLNPGKPKEHQGAKDYGRNQGSALQGSSNAIGGKDAHQSERHGDNDNNREISRGSSNENLHATSVAGNRRVCA